MIPGLAVASGRVYWRVLVLILAGAAAATYLSPAPVPDPPVHPLEALGPSAADETAPLPTAVEPELVVALPDPRPERGRRGQKLTLSGLSDAHGDDVAEHLRNAAQFDIHSQRALFSHVASSPECTLAWPLANALREVRFTPEVHRAALRSVHRVLWLHQKPMRYRISANPDRYRVLRSAALELSRELLEFVRVYLEAWPEDADEDIGRDMVAAVSSVNTLAADPGYDNGELARNLGDIGIRLDDLIVELRDTDAPSIGKMLGIVALTQEIRTSRTPMLLVELIEAHPTALPVASGWDTSYLSRVAKAVLRGGDVRALSDLSSHLVGILIAKPRSRAQWPGAEPVLGALCLLAEGGALPEAAKQRVKKYQARTPCEGRMVSLLLGTAGTSGRRIAQNTDQTR